MYRLTSVAARALAIGALVATAGGLNHLSAAGAPAPQAAPAAQRVDTTLFSHATHKSLACTACHSSKQEHGELTFTAPAGCQQCHHSEQQPVVCTACHVRTTLPSPTLAVTVMMTVWSAPRTRSLTFDHAKHTSLECRACHTAPTTLAVQRTCSSCHALHHTDSANCAACHAAVPIAQQTMHPRAETHNGCGASGCHQDPAVLALAPTRNVCLVCHRDKEAHQPGGDCAGCHLVRWAVGAHPGGSP